MGFLRKTLSVTTGGAVKPLSRKQRVAAQTLAAVQGRPRHEIQRIGTLGAGLPVRVPKPPGGRVSRGVAFTADEIAYMKAHAVRPDKK